MCDIHEGEFVCCCTPLCSKRKNIAPIENTWYYTPTGTAISELLYLQPAIGDQCTCPKGVNISRTSSSNLKSRSNSNSSCECAPTVASVVDAQQSSPQSAIDGDNTSTEDCKRRMKSETAQRGSSPKSAQADVCSRGGSLNKQPTCDRILNCRLDDVKSDGDGQAVVNASTNVIHLDRGGVQKTLDARSTKKQSVDGSVSPKGVVNVRLTRKAGAQLGLGIAGGLSINTANIPGLLVVIYSNAIGEINIGDL
ncbi:hypothetical protein Tcan_17372 [Toxocara canis]|uniref:Uncharacterized protein n=1 Tax=Toxocara canis TaxID=6265 RepID=A0A0B2UPJ8_TOXCA|nr:hypothetical protein Tcan_17372 [Toxocara canis]